MSTFRVTMERLVIEPHPNADALELATVGLMKAVVGRGIYTTGDRALYIPEQAILPDDLIEELGLTGRLAGKAKNRVKAVRLRGEISQGIVCRPTGAGVDWSRVGDCPWLDDYADVLGVTKWVPEIPPQMAGEAVSGADLLRWVDIENLQRYPDIFEPGEPVVVTEKIHGTCMVLTYVDATGEVLVSSKGLASNGIALREAEGNLYWRAARRYDLGKVARALADDYEADRVAIYGEVYGAGVQDLHYGANARADASLGFAAFDLRIDIRGELSDSTWQNSGPAFDNLQRYDVPTVPVLYEGPFDLDAIREAASGPSVLGRGVHIREGVVIRPAVEGRSEILGGRKIAKYVSPAYLTRGGNATEYE